MRCKPEPAIWHAILVGGYLDLTAVMLSCGNNMDMYAVNRPCSPAAGSMAAMFRDVVVRCRRRAHAPAIHEIGPSQSD